MAGRARIEVLRLGGRGGDEVVMFFVVAWGRGSAMVAWGAPPPRNCHLRGGSHKRKCVAHDDCARVILVMLMLESMVIMMLDGILFSSLSDHVCLYLRIFRPSLTVLSQGTMVDDTT